MTTSRPADGVLPLKRTPRTSLAQSVAAQLMDAFRDLEPGTRVPPERTLVQMLGVSRTTLREALRGLVVLGIVEVRHGQGVFVADRTPQAAEPDELAQALARGVTIDLVEARRAVLIEIATLAAGRRTDEDLQALESVLAAHRRALRAGRSPAHEGIRFDSVLAMAAHNDVMAGALRAFSRLIWPKAERLYESNHGFWDLDLEQHEAIYAAVKAADPDQAARAMAEHLGDVQSAYLLVGDA